MKQVNIRNQKFKIYNTKFNLNKGIIFYHKFKTVPNINIVIEQTHFSKNVFSKSFFQSILSSTNLNNNICSKLSSFISPTYSLISTNFIENLLNNSLLSLKSLQCLTILIESNIFKLNYYNNTNLNNKNSLIDISNCNKVLINNTTFEKNKFIYGIIKDFGYKNKKNLNSNILIKNSIFNKNKGEKGFIKIQYLIINKKYVMQLKQI